MDASSMNDTILDVEHMSMKFGGLVAIGDLSFQARRGEITALIGPNGAGKTTVFNCITGFYKPSEGMITLNRRDGSSYLLERLPNHEIPARAKVARTFQNIRLFSGMTVLENLLVAQHNKLMKASGYTILGLLGFRGYKQASAESIELAKHWLEKADLVDRADDPAGDLPYGAQRRLEIARAMCTGPELLCLDEPAAGLNPKESLALNTLLMGIKNDTGTSILLIEHDMSVVMQISDHVVVLEYGRKISDGDPQSVRSDPRVIAAYLGVDDEEVTEVLAEVGDEDVIEQLDAGPDAAHGPGASSSMMAGSFDDTIGHRDGERVTVAKGASKADRVKAAPAAVASTATAPAKTVGPAAKKAPARTAKQPMATAVAAKQSASVKPAATKSASKSAPVKSAPATGLLSPAKTAKPAPTTAGKSARPTPAKTTGMAPVPAKAASTKSATAKAPASKAASGKTASAKQAATKPAAAKSVAAKPAAKAIASKPTASKPVSAKTPAAKPVGISNRLSKPRGGKADNLTRIKGIGSVNEKKLNDHGIFHFDQIAAWKKPDIVAAEAYLAFDGRIAREGWVAQAKTLASGKETEFSRRVDAGKVETSHPSKTAAPAGGKRGGRK
ncbi:MULTISPECIES: ATP-binding cassette domain-containing protein [unclassified Mesorhizobium]|uniref:ATP-binding cassette domain-containing protein n=1 Tax=unclassified Mesorhizobium TaxID=325217 RepID=UPI0009E8CB61|nr:MULTISPECIES: ATP-binding cassette domain-containing protein [unclassified Mesorhizobium]